MTVRLSRARLAPSPALVRALWGEGIRARVSGRVDRQRTCEQQRSPLPSPIQPNPPFA